MKRRDLLKTSILGLSAGALTLSGCGKKEQSISNQSDEFDIIPKQTGTYEFSVPLPFNYKTIDEIAALNKSLKKSQITSFYNNAPNWEHNNWISISRAKNGFIKTYDDFFKYVDYAHNKGFNFTYLMNSPKPFSHKDFSTFEKDLDNILKLLSKHDCKDIKIGHYSTGKVINEITNGAFNLHVSTALEYNLVKQYEYLTDAVRNITLFDITNGENNNFKLLASLRKRFPNTKLELMVNESCLKGCPQRVLCISEDAASCFKLVKQTSLVNFFVRLGYIYPWNLEYYSALGINNFKFISSINKNNRSNYRDISSLKKYLDCVEMGIDNITIGDVFGKIFDKFAGVKIKNPDLKLSEVINLFPQAKYFVKHGSECAIRCGVDCNYCFDCAKNLENKNII